jgi:hypothetical protein
MGIYYGMNVDRDVEMVFDWRGDGRKRRKGALSKMESSFHQIVKPFVVYKDENKIIWCHDALRKCV